ncbi:MAG: hypothetical protein QM535_09605 [Limnohabitans sp.]|nr:hypothetical protein [Limnohabitans sp.]
MNTCAYFADKTYPTLQMLVYPDLVWIANLQYNFEEKGDYFFHDKSLHLETGIQTVVKEFKETLLYKILKFLPSNYVLQDAIEEYILGEADYYKYAAHVIHDRDIEKAGEALILKGKEVNLITQTEYTKYAAAAIYTFVLVEIAIEILIIYLTRGRNIGGKLGKIQKILRKGTASKLKLERKLGAEFEIIPPSIAINAGMYYKQRLDRRVEMVYEINVKADPLLAIQVKEEFDLADMLNSKLGIDKAVLPTDPDVLKQLKINIPGNEKLRNYLNGELNDKIRDKVKDQIKDGIEKKTGVKINGEITINGEIGFEHNVIVNVLTGEFTILDQLGNGFVNKNEVLLKPQIKFEAKIVGKYENEFKVFSLQNKIEGNLKIEISGALGLKISYGVDFDISNPNYKPKGIFFKQALYFSGLKGVYYGNYGLESDIFGKIEGETNNGKPHPFTLLEPFEMDLMTIQMFNHNK